MARTFSSMTHGRGKEPKEFAEEVVQIDRVTRVVKGGRRMRFRATVVIGNYKGKVGIGIGKANEVSGAIHKAVQKAKKNLITVPLRKDTIPHQLKVKFKSAKILLIPASQGTGIIAGGAVRKVVELAGIKNLLSKILGSSNKLNNTKATWLALKNMEHIPEKERQERKEVSEEIQKKKHGHPNIEKEKHVSLPT